MTDRHTREEIARMEAIAHGVNRVGNAANWTLVAYIGSGAGSGALIGYAINDATWRTAAGGAGIGGLLGLILFTVAVWDLARQTIDLRRARSEVVGDGWAGVQTGPRTINMLPAVYDERGREVDRWTRLEYDEYMAAVLDDDDDTGFNQRDASAFGHDRDKFNALVEWVHARGWYRFSNGTDNRHGGDFIAPHETILAPAPNDDNVRNGA